MRVGFLDLGAIGTPMVRPGLQAPARLAEPVPVEFFRMTLCRPLDRPTAPFD
jgi:hypothetical protein